MTYLDTMTLYDNLSNRYSFWCFLFFFSPFSSRCCTARRTLPRCQPTYCAGRGYIFIPLHRWISSFEIVSDLFEYDCQLIWHAFFVLSVVFTTLSLALDCLNCHIAVTEQHGKNSSNSRCVAVDSVDSLDLAGFAGSIVEALRDGKGGDSAPKRVRFGLACVCHVKTVGQFMACSTPLFFNDTLFLDVLIWFFEYINVDYNKKFKPDVSRSSSIFSISLLLQ